MNDLTGTAALIRLILRRDRIRISIWVVSIALLVSLSAVGVKSLFPTQAAIDQAATATQYNAGAIAFNGPAQGLDTLGGQIAFQVGALGMVVVALMSVFMIGRLTRGDEESGRLELVRSLPVGVHAPTFAALIVVLAMSAAVGVLSSASLLAEGLPTAGSLVLGASFAAVGLFFTGVALVAAQITQNTRVVYGSSGALLGLAYMLRIVGDIGDGTVSWFSPIGLAQKARPFAGERWWPLVPLLAAAAALIAVAFRLAVRRDHGAGLVAPRPGRAVASPSLGHPLGLAMRLQRGALIGWGAGVLVTGIAYGWIAPTIDSFVANNKAFAQMMASAGVGSLTDTYFATSFGAAPAERGVGSARGVGARDTCLAVALGSEPFDDRARRKRRPARRRRPGHRCQLRDRGGTVEQRAATAGRRDRVRAGDVADDRVGRNGLRIRAAMGRRRVGHPRRLLCDRPAGCRASASRLGAEAVSI